MQVARRVQHERRIKHGKSKRTEDLNEEQGRGSLSNAGEPAFPEFHDGFQSLIGHLDRESMALPGWINSDLDSSYPRLFKNFAQPCMMAGLDSISTKTYFNPPTFAAAKKSFQSTIPAPMTTRS